MKLTLLEHPTASTSKNFQARLEEELDRLKGELDATFSLYTPSGSGWAQVEITGEDNEIVSELIADKFALAHTYPNDIEPQGNYQAEIMGTSDRGLNFDVGIGRGRFECVVPTGNLNAQLADGKNLPLRHVVECYCLYPGMKIAVRIARKTDREIEGWLADRFMDRLDDWNKIGLDRILAFECFRKEAESSVLKAHLTRDVIAVDSLGLTVQSIVCKLGTDAVGLIPKLGRILRNQPLKPFQPKKIKSRCRPW
jgi:hypothetical protein